MFWPNFSAFGLFWASFLPCSPGLKAQQGLAGSSLLFSYLFTPLPNQNRPSGPIAFAKRLFSAYLGHFLAPLGPMGDILGLANWPNWSAWMSSMPFQPCSNIVPLYRWSHMNFWPFFGGFFWALGGPKYEKCPVVKLEQRSMHLVGPQKKKLIDDSDGALSLNAYHLCMWYLTVQWRVSQSVSELQFDMNPSLGIFQTHSIS